jgi:hypothetical protein
MTVKKKLKFRMSLFLTVINYQWTLMRLSVFSRVWE